MEIDFLKGNWLGFYMYGDNYGMELQGKRTHFEIRFFVKDGVLLGACYDEDKLESFDKPANITEITLHNNTIRFVKGYAFLYAIDDNGQVTFDNSKKHPPIDYSGAFDVTNNSFSGNWKMELIESTTSNKIVKHIFSGKWFMKKR